MTQADNHSFKVSNQVMRVLTLLLGIAATYFLTIQSLRLELAAKAESEVVETLDKKLGNFEVLLKEGVISKEEFYQFSRDIEGRLARIEYFLIDKWGNEIEGP
jgi:hypothetical protein